MSTVIGSLTIEMAANVARIQRDFDQIKGLAGQTMGEITKLASQAQEQLAAMGKAAVVAFTGIGAIASIGAFKNMIEGAIEARAHMYDLSVKTGVAAEQLSALAKIGKFTGTSADDIGNAIAKLNKNLAGTDEDSKGAAQALQALGLNFDKFKSMGADQQMLAIAQAMNKFQDGGDKAAAAMMLLGKSGADMLPYLKKLGEQTSLVGSITSESAGQAKKYQESLIELQIAGEAWKKTLVNSILPALFDVQAMTKTFGEQLKEYVADGASKSKTEIEGMSLAVRGFGTFMETMLVLGANVSFVFKGIGREIGAIIAQFQAFETGDWSAIGRIHQEAVADAEKARAELDKFEKSILGVTEKTSQQIELSKKSGVTTADNARELAKFNELSGNAGQKLVIMGKAARDAADAASKLVEQGQKLAVALLGESSGLSSNFFEQWDKLSAAFKAGGISLEVLIQAQRKLLADQPAMRDAHKQVVDAANAAAEARRKEADGIDAYLAHLAEKRVADVKAANDSVDAAQREYDSFGLLRSQIAQLTLQRLVDQRSRLAAGSAAYDAVQAEIDAQQKLIAILKKGEARDQMLRDAEDLQRVFDGLGQTLEDALFNGGHSALQKIKDDFKRAVIHVAVQAALGSAMNAYAGGGGGAGGSGSSLGGIIGAGIGAYGLFGGMSDAAVGQGLSSLYGTSNVAFDSTIFGAAGGEASISAGALGATEGVAGGAAAASEGAAVAGAGAGAGATASELIATFGPYALIALAVFAALGDHSKWSMGSVSEGMFGSGGKFGATQFALPYTFGNNTEHERDSKYLTQIRDQIGSSMGGAIKSLGGSAAGLGLSISTDTDREGKAAAIVSLLRDGHILGGTQTGSGAFGAALPTVAASKMEASQLAQWFQTALPTIIVEALQASDIESRFKDYFNSVAQADLTPDKAQQMLAVAQAVKQVTDSLTPLGGVFTQLTGLSVQATKDLADASGGFDALRQSVASYYQNFYTEAQRTQIAWDGITKTLADAGVTTVPKTKDQFVALVNSLTLGTEAGDKAFTALMSVNGALSSLISAADQAAKAEHDRLAAIDSKQLDLQIQLLKAQGNEEKAVALERQRVIDQLAALEQSTGAAAGTFTNLQKSIDAATDAAAEQAKAQAQAQAATKTQSKSFWLGAAQAASTANDQAWANGAIKQFLADLQTKGSSVWNYIQKQGIDAAIAPTDAGWTVAGDKAITGPTTGALQNWYLMQKAQEEEQARASGYDQYQDMISRGLGGQAVDNGEAQRQQEQLNATLQLINSLNALKDSFTKYRDGLDFGGLSTLGAETQYEEARKIADSMYQQSLAGDSAARDQVQSSIDRFLTISKAYHGSNAAFAQDSDLAKKMLDTLIAKMDKFVAVAQNNVSVSAEGAKQTVTALTINNKLFRQMADATVVEAQQSVE